MSPGRCVRRRYGEGDLDFGSSTPSIVRMAWSSRVASEGAMAPTRRRTSSFDRASSGSNAARPERVNESRCRRRTADERLRRAPRSPCGPDPMTRGLARQFRLHWLRLLRGSRFRGLVLELGDHLAEDLDQTLPLRAVARAPGRLVGALVRELVLHARHLGRIAVGVELGDHLVREDVPVVRRAEGRTRAFRRPSLPPLDDRILELPLVWRDLFLRPVPRVVLPFVTAADLHAGVALALMLLELVVGCIRHALT